MLVGLAIALVTQYAMFRGATAGEAQLGYVVAVAVFVFGLLNAGLRGRWSGHDKFRRAALAALYGVVVILPTTIFASLHNDTRLATSTHTLLRPVSAQRVPEFTSISDVAAGSSPRSGARLLRRFTAQPQPAERKARIFFSCGFVNCCQHIRNHCNSGMASAVS